MSEKACFDSNSKQREGIGYDFTVIVFNDFNIDILKYIKVYNGRVCASNLLSQNKKKEPLTKIGEEGITGVELLVYPDTKTINFFSIISSQKGYGRKMVESCVEATPEDWTLAVVIYRSGGFWERMIEEYSRVVVL